MRIVPAVTQRVIHTRFPPTFRFFDHLWLRLYLHNAQWRRKGFVLVFWGYAETKTAVAPHGEPEPTFSTVDDSGLVVMMLKKKQSIICIICTRQITTLGGPQIVTMKGTTTGFWMFRVKRKSCAKHRQTWNRIYLNHYIYAFITLKESLCSPTLICKTVGFRTVTASCLHCIVCTAVKDFL